MHAPFRGLPYRMASLRLYVDTAATRRALLLLAERYGDANPPVWEIVILARLVTRGKWHVFDKTLHPAEVGTATQNGGGGSSGPTRLCVVVLTFLDKPAAWGQEQPSPTARRNQLVRQRPHLSP